MGFLHFRGKNASLHKYRWGWIALHFGGSKVDSFPMWGRIAVYFEEESMTPSPCGEGRIAFQGEESLTPSPRVKDSHVFDQRKHKSFPMWGRICGEE